MLFLQDIQHLQTYDETAAVALVADRKLRDLPGDHIYRVLVDIRVWVLRKTVVVCMPSVVYQIFLKIRELEDSAHRNFLYLVS